jgi:hypothetical protein
MGILDVLEMLADPVDAAEEAFHKAVDVEAHAEGLLGRGYTLVEKAATLSKLHKRMDDLAEEEERPGTVRFLFEIGKHLLDK